MNEKSYSKLIKLKISNANRNCLKATTFDLKYGENFDFVIHQQPVSEKYNSDDKRKMKRAMLVSDSPGGVMPGLGLQTDSLNPLKSMALGRSREPESPPAACTFPQTSSPTLQGISMSLMGGMMGADGFTAQGVRAK